MNNSKLIQFLNVLDKQEMNVLKKMVISPFFNENKDNILFFEYLHRNFPFTDTSKLEKEYIYSKIRPGKKYDDGWMRKRMSDLFGIVKKYIYQVEASHSQDMLKYIHFCESHNLFSYMDEGLKEYRYEEILSPEYENSESLYRKAKYTESEFRFQYSQGHQKPKTVTLVDVIRDYYTASLARQLELQCALINNLKYTKQEGINRTYLKIFSGIQKEEALWQIPFIRMYFHVYNLLEHEKNKEDHFDQALECYLTERGRFSPVDKGTFTVYLKNFCNQQIIRGNSTYKLKLQSIFEAMAEDGSLLMNNYIPADVFLGVIINASQLALWEWIKAFRQKHEDLLLPDDKAGVVYSTDAIILIAQKQNKQAAKVLQEVPKMKSGILEVRIRVLRIINYFELYGESDDADGIRTSLESFKQYLYRYQAIAENLKIRYLNFVKYFCRMLETPEFERQDLFRLYDEIMKETVLYEREWLAGKVKEKSERR